MMLFVVGDIAEAPSVCELLAEMVHHRCSGIDYRTHESAKAIILVTGIRDEITR